MAGRSSDADVIVIGAGIHGSATAASLARRGRRVIAIDRFAVDHVRGSSHGRTRMIRRAYPNPVWNDLVDRAFRGWESLERETGQTLLHITGGLYAHAGESQLQGPDCVLVEDRAELERLMPDFRVPDGYRAVYDPHAGVVEASRGLAALRAVAEGHGADLRFDERLLGWDAIGDGVEVRTDAGTLRADRLVIAAGAFAASIVPQLAPLLEVWRILTVTVAPGQKRGRPPGLGAFSVDREGGLVFGIPDADGNGVKLGVDARRVWDPEVAVAAPTDAEVAEMLALLSEYVPGLDHRDLEATACLYTMTEDKRFIIGPLAETPQVVVVSACSGHGFKFAPAIGDAAADLADGIARDDLAFVSTARRGI
ncbi:N-methyl-L-tryptophan oxidase [Microbacterium rhizomatis]|uniref:N-methyl-L-tryptophan oxidase n=1 Tax=Microbacterium rhizomatis TaxID=1631477 RepID=A0A5J5J140_9MICO|nr:N-methyl-L-tryptophan oxidase [Microbacterium rhizomatis]KAA9108067.1 N-methyl-L-tryptophan oxidase [Microbacterium rhizomatis]